MQYKGKGFPYSLPSIGARADSGVQAVSPQVAIRTKFGDRAFSIAGPKAWNNLPQSVRSADSLKNLNFIFLTHVLMFELFMYVYFCNALSARFSAVYRALNSYFMIMIVSLQYMASTHDTIAALCLNYQS